MNEFRGATASVMNCGVVNLTTTFSFLFLVFDAALGNAVGKYVLKSIPQVGFFNFISPYVIYFQIHHHSQPISGSRNYMLLSSAPASKGSEWGILDGQQHI